MRSAKFGCDELRYGLAPVWLDLDENQACCCCSDLLDVVISFFERNLRCNGSQFLLTVLELGNAAN
jgi:hypothetical protein